MNGPVSVQLLVGKPNLAHVSMRAAVSAAAGTAAGAMVGAAIGWAGGSLHDGTRLAAAGVVGALLAVLGLVELLRRSGPVLLQLDRETNVRWLDHGGLRWAVKNGASLGIGFATRLGFTIWYAVPLAAFVIGRPAMSAVVFAAYSAARTLPPLVVHEQYRRWGKPFEWGALLDAKPIARRVSGVLSITSGVAVALSAAA